MLLIANKVDDERLEADAAALWNLGLGRPWELSALHGRGSGDLLDAVLDALPETPAEIFGAVSGPRRVALVGKPNVGKSSLLNKLTGENRSVVDSVAGTTVDPVDSLVELDGEVWRFVDTAGLRRRVSHAAGMEYYASLRTQTAIETAEVAVVLVDSSEPLTEQDQRVISMVEEAGRALIVALNKADLVDADRRADINRELERDLVRVPWATTINISALTGRAVQRLAPALRTALESWDKRDPHRAAQRLPRRGRPGHAAAGAWRQAAQDPVRHPGRQPAADVRAVHQRLPRGRLPPVHRAAPARGVRLRRLARPDQRPGAREAQRPGPRQEVGPGSLCSAAVLLS